MSETTAPTVIVTPPKRIYGWKPDLPDHRDTRYGATLLRSEMLPQEVDLRSGMPPVFNQLDLGSCSANAWLALVWFIRNKANLPNIDLSRLFLYYNERAIENNIATDAGAFLRDGAWSLANDGVCNEVLWDYDISKFADKPTVEAYTDGKKQAIASYIRLNTLNDMLHCLVTGYPFVLGITVFTSFESEEVAKTGIVPMPSPDDSSLGGHAVVACGYSLTKNVFYVRNSWGADWGQQGYFELPFKYITGGLADDFWTARV